MYRPKPRNVDRRYIFLLNEYISAAGVCWGAAVRLQLLNVSNDWTRLDSRQKAGPPPSAHQLEERLSLLRQLVEDAGPRRGTP
ncbi:MAG: hypothetical protein ACO2PM_07500, partial [Pyrobaculum sp.]